MNIKIKNFLFCIETRDCNTVNKNKNFYLAMKFKRQYLITTFKFNNNYFDYYLSITKLLFENVKKFSITPKAYSIENNII